MRRRRRHVAEPGAGSCASTDADPGADANSNADAHSNPDANTDARRWDDDHHHIRRRVTKDADRATGNTRHVRKQRHAGA